MRKREFRQQRIVSVVVFILGKLDKARTRLQIFRRGHAKRLKGLIDDCHIEVFGCVTLGAAHQPTDDRIRRDDRARDANDAGASRAECAPGDRASGQLLRLLAPEVLPLGRVDIAPPAPAAAPATILPGMVAARIAAPPGNSDGAISPAISPPRAKPGCAIT
jgi:hypothetical protein